MSGEDMTVGAGRARVALTTADIEAYCKTLREILEASRSDRIGTVFGGPRHNEIGFETPDGGLIVLSLRSRL